MSDFSVPVSASRSWYYRGVQPVVGAALKAFFGHETTGVHNIPAEEGAVIATNHKSVLDPPLVGVNIPRPIYYMAKKSLHDIPVFGSFLRAFYSFPVKRGGFNRGAMRKAVEIVEKGNLLLIFPEGTRSPDGTIQEFKSGVGKIVLDADCPVVPGHIKGAEKAWPKSSWLPRPRKTSVTFGSPRKYEELADGEKDRTDYRRVAQDLQEAVKNLG